MDMVSFVSLNKEDVTSLWHLLKRFLKMHTNFMKVILFRETMTGYFCY